MEAPLWFIKTDKHGQMSVNKDVAHVLAQAEGSIGVIAIVGKLLRCNKGVKINIGEHILPKLFLSKWFLSILHK